MSRRDFVGGTALAGTAFVVGGCVPRGSGVRAVSAAGDSVLIVGAGLAGLVAAKTLRAAGVRVHIVEAQNRVGGRVFSLRDHFADGQVAELGGELIDTGHEVMRGLASELGLELEDLADEDPGLSTILWHFDGAAQSDVAIVEAFMPLAGQIALAVATLNADLTYADPGAAVELDRLSIAEWLERVGVSGLARKLVDVAYTTEYGTEIDEQSCLNLLFVLDPSGDPAKLFGESDTRYHVRGGNDRIVSGLAEPLEDAIETTTELESIGVRSDGALACAFRRGASSFSLHASDVLLALPFTMLREIEVDVPLPAVKRRAIAELGYGTNAKLMVGFSERVWRERWRSNGSVLTDLAFQQTWETSRKQSGRAGILTNFTGGRHGIALGQGSASSQATALVAGLLPVYPGIALARGQAREARMHWPTHPYVRGSYACYRPGQWTGMRGAEFEPVGGLFFAGEHCSMGAQGFMEGACETGLAAARQILARRGVRAGARPLSRRRLLAGR